MKNELIRSVCWDITSRCNEKCGFCYRNAQNKELAYEENKKILKKLIDLGVNKISFVGGEPLLYDKIFSLVKWGREYCHGQTLFSITTNAILLTYIKDNIIIINKEKIQEMLEVFDWITLSLDASNALIQEKVGRNKYHFDRIIKILDYVRDKNVSSKIKINTMVCKENINDLENLFYILQRYEIKRWKMFRFLASRGNALKNRDRYYVSQEEFLNSVKCLEQLELGNIKISINDYDSFDNSYVNISSEGTLVVYNNNTYEEKMDLKTDSIVKIYDFINIEKHCENRSDFTKV